MTKFTYDKYSKLVKGKRWTESEIRGFCKLLNALRFGGEYVNGQYQQKRDAQLIQLESQLGEYSITREQSLKGIEYLRRRYFKLNGEPRKSSPFGYFENAVIRNFKRFTFVGYHVETNGYTNYYLPVYRVHSKSGAFFDYAPVHWGTPIVLYSGHYIPLRGSK